MANQVNKSLHDQREEMNRQKLRRYVLHTLGASYWEALCRAIQQDAEKLNAKALPLLKTAIEINRRELIPDGNELHVDCLAFPALYLTLQLDLDAERIRINQKRVESPECPPEQETTEILQIDLTNNSTEIVFIDSQGKRFDISEVSQYVLIRFLNR